MKKSSGTLYWGAGPLAESDLTASATSWKDYVFFNGKRVARRDASNSSVHYFFSDHLGSTSVTTNSTGATLEQDLDYFPYGGIASGSSSDHYLFTGKERDIESGLDNLGARHYASSAGRFMQVDPITVTMARQVDPQQLNLYSYVKNNPLTLIDPTGMVIDETQLSEGDLEKWQDVEKLASETDSEGNLLHPELYSGIVQLQQDSRTYTLQGPEGLGSGVAGKFEITNFTADGKDFTAATIKLDFNKIKNGKGVTAAGFDLGYSKFGGVNSNARRFAELVGHEFAHALFAKFAPGVGTEIQRLTNEAKQALETFRSTDKKSPLPPDVIRKMQAGNTADDATERFAQQIEKIVNGELRASERK